MKISHLDDLDELDLYDSTIQGEWIMAIPDYELYQIACWLLHHLGPNRFQTNHDRTKLLGICQQYNQTKSLSNKQKFYLGYGVIALWNERQIETDPRYQL